MGVSKKYFKVNRSRRKPLQRIQVNRSRAQFASTTRRQARNQRLIQLILYMRQKPQKARKWLLHMKQMHAQNVKVLEILSKLESLRCTDMGLIRRLAARLLS